ncbi:MAG: hypothetical protein WC405_14410 [Syntrophales bacterium]
MSIIESLSTGAIGSLIASALFLFIMYRHRPKLEISPNIAKTTYDGKTVYAIKVINSGSRDAFAIRAEFLMIEPWVVSGGIGSNILQFSLVRDQWFILNPTSKVGDTFGSNFEFITNEDLEGDWVNHENSYLLFRVHAQDVLSGFARVFVHQYYSRKAIIEGRFAKGASMEISE